MKSAIISSLTFSLIVSPLTLAQDLPRLKGRTMGNDYLVTWDDEHHSPKKMISLYQQIEQRLSNINSAMSTWDKQSELSQINHSSVTTNITMSPELTHVVVEAKRLAELTQGALDVTVTPLIQLWGFGEDSKARTQPSDAAIAHAMTQVGIDKISINGNQLTREHDEVRINLSAIAKGYGVDAIAEVLKENGINNFLVDIGGEVKVSGTKQDEPWVVGIEKPAAYAANPMTAIALTNKAVATSGDYRNYFKQDGKHYSHIINPKTGKPVPHQVVSTTVIHDSCMTADGLATALMIMPIKDSLALAEKMALPVMIIENQVDELVIHESSAFKQYQP
ncbi:FAD:protein FMN transferase [Shewanella sp. WXL01]|uniref:FAD:protein FMN transferase n=1 Tax=Shewanella sp. WXL01 TaxID=2709721 RepID=UPI001438574F|nr:FAD:protein FMN transferase [Shewanella sp. WXL01]NKF49217.1 FAD:protein FMN transferase [Shewanella sp. WXL01]